jgi:hypothetical protein
MRKALGAWRSNIKLARSAWGALSPSAMNALRVLTTKYSLSVATGDLQFLEGRWYVTHAGLLGISERRRCFGIRTAVEKTLSDPGRADGCSRQRSTRLHVRKASSATVTPIPRMSLPWSAALRCASPRREPSTAPCARPMASVCVPSKNSVPVHPSSRPRTEMLPILLPGMAPGSAKPASAIGSAS